MVSSQCFRKDSKIFLGPLPNPILLALGILPGMLSLVFASNYMLLLPPLAQLLKLKPIFREELIVIRGKYTHTMQLPVCASHQDLRASF